MAHKNNQQSKKGIIKRIFIWIKERVIPGPLNYNLLFAVIFLNIFGIIMIYSASYNAAVKMGYSEQYFMSRQLLFFAIGLLALWLVSFLDYHTFTGIWMGRAGYVIALACVFALKIPGIGVGALGAVRWLKIGPFRFQAAEPIKLSMILFLAAYVSRFGIEGKADKQKPKTKRKPKEKQKYASVLAGAGLFCLKKLAGLIQWYRKNRGTLFWILAGSCIAFPVYSFTKSTAAALAVPVLLIFLGFRVQIVRLITKTSKYTIWAAAIFLAGCLGIISDNMSTAIIILGICFFTFMACDRRKWQYVVCVLAIGAVAVGALLLINWVVPYSETENFRITRVRAFLHPEEYASTTSLQALQALYAIGSGGFWGRGLGQSLVKFKLSEPYNDYILAILIEELGAFGVILLLFLFGYLLFQIYRTAREAVDVEGKVLCLGVFAHIALQTILNVMVVLNWFPTTGVTLPFISYGGSSVVFLMVELGVVFNVDKYSKYRKYRFLATREIDAEAKRREMLSYSK